MSPEKTLGSEADRLEAARKLLEGEEFEEAVNLLEELVKGEDMIKNPSLVHETTRLYTSAKLHYNGSRMLEAVADMPKGEVTLDEFVEFLAGKGIELDAATTRAVLEQYILAGRLAASLVGDVLTLK
ncbi:MAG: hypothetical protein ACTSU5_00845 [Promethearchaeota archaeon]